MKPAHTLQKIPYPYSWNELPWGEYYRETLEQQLQSWWPKLFGFHLLKIGNLSVELDTEHCAISHQVNVSLHGHPLHVLADPYQLPFATKSIDACLLAHTLSYINDPHRLLREVDRVMIDDGWVVISCFNPFSLLGLGKLLPTLKKRQPYISRMFPLMRLLDWLSLLNYEVLEQTHFHVLPWQRDGGRFLNEHLPVFGCMNLIIARKRTLPLTPTSVKLMARSPALNQPVGATKSYTRRQ